MVLRVKCKCGKSLKIPHTLAGKKIACPGCKKAFSIPPDKFQAAAAKAQRASKASPGAVAAQPKPMPSPAALDAAPAELDLGIPADDAGNSPPGETPPSALAVAQDEACAAAATAVTLAPTLGYAADSTANRGRQTGVDVPTIQNPKRTFWKDIIYAFAYPVASRHNLINFAIVLFIATVAQFVGCFGLIMYGWMASIYMKAVSSTAVGDDDFDGPTMEGGIVEAIVTPAATFIATFLLAMSPMILYLILAQAGVMPASTTMMVTWTAFGVFMWPMIMLLFSLSSWSYIFQVHLVFATIARTIAPYSVIWIALLISLAVMTASSELTTLLAKAGFTSFMSKGPNASGIASMLSGWVGRVVLDTMFEIYFSVVSMRLIGLYYLHYKNRFAFVME